MGCLVIAKNPDFGSDGDGTKPQTLKPSATQSIRLYESDIYNLRNVTKACKANDDSDVDDPAYDAVFVKSSLFKELVRAYKSGKPVPDSDMEKPDISRYQFLSHVRNANTQGTAESGGGMGMGIFSVIFSHRTGPIGLDKAAPVIAHLVSLEGIPSMKWPIPDSSKNRQLADRFRKETQKAMDELAAPAEKENNDDHIYNELNKPTSTDWMTVLAWVLDRKFASGIPAHYLIMDPSFLPAESLRFFQIDQSWTDAMIDGALSIGNHLESHNDKIRAAIKRALNRHCKTPIKQLQHPPQIPCFGFLLRSDLVTQFPDIRVEVGFDPPLDETSVPILRHENIADGVMLCLFDRVPGKDEQGGLESIRFTQPPHQQSFSIGAKLDKTMLRPTYRRIFCDYDGKSDRYDVYKRLLNDMPQKGGKSMFTDDAPTAAMVGIQLNDSCYELVISLEQMEDVTPQPHVLNMMQPWSTPAFVRMMMPSLMDLEPAPPFAALPPLQDRADLDTWNNNPDFQYNIYPIAAEADEIGPLSDVKVTTNGGYAQDLVFSIVLNPSNLRSELRLQDSSYPWDPKVIPTRPI
ncbi:hypothetical protein V8C35DRAFT_333529 [Trichoderma chlorosporum]